MTQYLVAIYHPDDHDLSTEDEAMSRDIDPLNDEMKAAAHLDDSKLISDGLQGDRNAFESLFSRYRPILYRLAQRILRNHEESEDAVQNCSLVAFRKMESFTYEGAFRSWLARILVNEAIAILRRRKRTYSSECLIPKERAEAADLLPDSGPNPFPEAKCQCLAAQTRVRGGELSFFSARFMNTRQKKSAQCCQCRRARFVQDRFEPESSWL